MTDVTQVLTGAPPALTPSEAVDAAARCFGVTARTAVDCGSERDQTFALDGADGERLAILKVSNELEDPEVLDMEADVALHVIAVDPALSVALPWRTAESGDPGAAVRGDSPDALRTRWKHRGGRHWLRLYDALPGNSRIDASGLSDFALTEWGATAARLAQAMQGYGHARAKRRMLWDIQHATDVIPMAREIADPVQQRLVVATLTQFERHLSPVWATLRAQTLHTDLTTDNALSDERGLVTGIIDFGDMSHTALISDLASVLDSLAAGREGEELFRLARLTLDGYQRHIELTDAELRLAPLAWATRSAITIAISSWRASRGLEERAFAERYNARCARVLATMERVGWDEVTRMLGGGAPVRSTAGLATRRAAVLGPAMEALFYETPVEVATGDGVWILEADGRRLLDAYNNVPTVGHAHPRVTCAIARQSRRINTHMRYLHPSAIQLAERLAALAGEGLDTVMLVNSGSEANDLAWRMACAATGGTGGLCTASAYHGITESTAALSPEGWLDAGAVRHPDVEVWRPPDTCRGRFLDSSEMTAALGRLRRRGLTPAAAILDGLLMSDGVHDLSPALVGDWAEQVHAAGGLWIADEVQASHGRNGESFFAYQHLGISPDFITLGKPMGNGHPVAAVLTRRAIAEVIAARTVLFSTFGGNPVSAAAALAVLDVYDDERVIQRVHETGRQLRERLLLLAAESTVIGEVRGIGLAVGVEFVASSPDDMTVNPRRAQAVRDEMRMRGVLVGTTGPADNVLKIRPPLAFSGDHVPILYDCMKAALEATADRPSGSASGVMS